MDSQKPSILAVDDETDILEAYRSILSKKYNFLSSSSGIEALDTLKNNSVSLVLLDMKMPKMNGLEVLKKIKEQEPELDVIVVTASKDTATAVEAMKAGALDYITKPFEVKELQVIIEKALEKRALVRENLYLKEALKEATSYCDLIGQAPAMKKLYETIDRVSPTDSTVLIHGESGTGKELVARAIHTRSKRTNKPFITINCAAIPESLLESELFGHERGAFTGALEKRIGKFELADGGSIFLDEIGCMTAAMQAKLLRVVENKVVERVGGEKGIPVNVRIISATNIDFEKEIKERRFRHDLYYRLNVIPIKTIPLRERKEDIPLFAQHFLGKFNREMNKNFKGPSEEALRSLMEYDWPGNVRELQNVVERMVVLESEEFLPSYSQTIIESDGENEGILKQALDEREKQLIAKALAKCGNNRSQAAKILGIARSSLNSKIEALGLS